MASGRLVLQADPSPISESGDSNRCGSPMVRPGARKGDDDLGPVTDRTGQVEGRAVTALSRGMRGRHSTLDIPFTSAPIGPSMHYEPGVSGSSIQPPLIPFRTRHPTTSHHSYTLVPYDPYEYSQPLQTSYDPYAHAPSLPIRMPGLDPTQYFSKTQIPLNETCPADGGPQDLVLVPSYSGHVAGSIWRRQDRDILKSRSRYVSVTGWTLSYPAVVRLVGDT
ncbi:hypothetical protein M9H77_04147 [Catharanthus roseus]|uniref:Uncharacterized protein n=1 Tax=Catharanthus roseus TaxID=4058 RepID=A0ACC0CDQ3_CATRO|nr:hypothetical protein M9H77_04147 [Catharanthus roseus]